MLESNISCRQSFTNTILECAKKDKEIIIVTSDAAGTVTLNKFAQELPGQFIEVGIAEQNAIGVAAGIASVGKKVFVCGPACFYTSRSLEQIKVDIAYSGMNVKIIGVNGGVSYGAFGATHHCLHDIAALRTFPGIQIIAPCDALQAKVVTEKLLNHEMPVYVRMGRNSVPRIYTENNPPFEIGKANMLAEGNDITIIGTGETVYYCLQAADRLKNEGIYARVLDMHTLKPADKEAVLKAAKETGRIITVEEHSIYGGLGAIVSEIVVQNYPVPMKILGIPDENVINANPVEIFAYYKIDEEGIFQEAINLIRGVPD